MSKSQRKGTRNRKDDIYYTMTTRKTYKVYRGLGFGKFTAKANRELNKKES